ncbi:methyltransferase domain-containing protein [candidate division KSB1 bacterium]|nr:methyltransferase domain-containing protein [candidate division KSB1 bacterium]NIV70740.1 methyltransferase domain-containing protein [Phycisphaerae bacterium]NIR73401.1 methyltransferase domain-containing protein [candidate division KSB1 bacterium]NIS23942.1 methyltransferase domain-containing protein [candidate division KSB1 bacterium]NIT70859.1 methyltransferase domain-containing protein [candidate division KSB1 bacterium]
MPETYTCRSCSATKMSVFYEVQNVPVHSVLLMRSREAAVNYPKGDIVLAFCPTCGFISNAAFDPVVHEYSSDYEETQGFSPTFNSFHRRLATDLINRYDLHKKNIIEIGCGKGEFLALLCNLGDNRGLGFDPAYVSERNPSTADNRITFIQDFYSEEYAHHRGNFICCKMTLEHIQDTADFVSMVRRSIGDRLNTTVFFQVPEIMRILGETAFWDIYYEHCSYFSRGSLARLFRKCGFDVHDLWTDYDDQYLMIEARPGDGSGPTLLEQEKDLEVLKQNVEHFSGSVANKINQWRDYVEASKKDGKRIVLWGGGSKGVAFLTTLGIRDEIEFVVDINPYKHHTYMAGTGHEIVPLEFLQEYRPDVVIVMNPIYCEEIQQSLNKMGVAAEVMPV